MAVGGAGILGGMSPKGYIDMEGAEQIAESVAKSGKTEPPGAVDIHYTETGFFREVYASEEGVLEGIKKYIGMLRATIRNSSVLTIRKHRPCLWMTSTPWFR